MLLLLSLVVVVFILLRITTVSHIGLSHHLSPVAKSKA